MEDKAKCDQDLWEVSAYSLQHLAKCVRIAICKYIKRIGSLVLNVGNPKILVLSVVLIVTHGIEELRQGHLWKGFAKVVVIPSLFLCGVLNKVRDEDVFVAVLVRIPTNRF